MQKFLQRRGSRSRAVSQRIAVPGSFKSTVDARVIRLEGLDIGGECTVRDNGTR